MLLFMLHSTTTTKYPAGSPPSAECHVHAPGVQKMLSRQKQGNSRTSRHSTQVGHEAIADLAVKSSPRYHGSS
jgi:hypothetical protein